MNNYKLIGLVLTMTVLTMTSWSTSHAQETLPWQNGPGAQSGDSRTYQEPGENYDSRRHDNDRQTQFEQGASQDNPPPQNQYDQGYDALRNNGATRPPSGADQSAQDRRGSQYEREDGRDYRGQEQYGTRSEQDRNTIQRDRARSRDAGRDQGYQPPTAGGPGQAYAPPPPTTRPRMPAQRPARGSYGDTYSDDEILDAGHRFFGKVTKGLAKVIAHVFKKSGRPNAYILGEEGGGALIAGLRYGEGTIYTKAGDRQRIYWQGPSIGYDFGAEGAKTMILVYNLRRLDEVYERFAGVDGSAYLVGGVGVTFQKRGRVVLAPIRSGVGVRLGANVGYLKYTRRPTWNPF